MRTKGNLNGSPGCGQSTCCLLNGKRVYDAFRTCI